MKICEVSRQKELKMEPGGTPSFKRVNVETTKDSLANNIVK